MAELIRETVCVGERSIPAFTQVCCEADLIVPDVNPDISKILQAGANAMVTGKNCGSNRIAVDGRMDILILYLGEDGCVYSINGSQPFSHMIDASGIAEGMQVELELHIEAIEYTIVNSRKLHVKGMVDVDANASADLHADLCTGIVTDVPYEIRMQTIQPFRAVACTSEQICIKERLELPVGKPSVERILRLDAALREKTYQPINDKLIVKGILEVKTVYLCDTDAELHLAEYELPVTEVLELPGITEGMVPACRMHVDKTYCKPEQDADGDNRYIDLECLLSVCTRVYGEYPMEIVEDAYSTKYPVRVVRDGVKVSRLTADAKSQLSVKDLVTLPADLPEVTQVYHVIATPRVGATRIENGRIVVDGMIEADILYLSSDPKHPLNVHRHQQKFSHCIDASGISDAMLCDLCVEVEHVSYTTSMGRELELRFVLGMEARVLSEDALSYITAIEADETTEIAPSKAYCIKIYFVRQEDSLWEIAKRYHVTCEALIEMNHLTEGQEVLAGQQILIPIK